MSTSPNITQNRIYRSTTSGGPYTLVATIPATTSYQNNGLTSGTTYYYVVTAVNGGSLESGSSNQGSGVPR
jgi:cellulose 1,4-beta-cellobiosidase